MGKKVLVLGGGLLQIPLILKAREQGYQVYLSDYYPDPPGKKYSHTARQISTFSVEDNYRYALEENIDYIMTIGTDQPVYTAAAVSERLGLPFPITEEQGKSVTNKLYMKAKMAEHGIPTPSFKVFARFSEFSPDGLRYPLVMKPVDSQGQRGIFVLEGREDRAGLKEKFALARQFSLTKTVIVEEFYPGDEITVNCWVKDGQAFNLLITDRLHFDDSIALGVCKQQRYPSRRARGRQKEIDGIVQNLVNAFGIKDGPLYIQMVVGIEGSKIIEFGYRIGGGFESETIPQVTGVDILDLYFTLVTEGKNLFEPGQVREKARLGSIFFMFAQPGVVEKISVPQDFAGYHGRIFVKEGKQIAKIENATSRVGCFDFYTDNPEEYYRFIKRFDAELAFYDKNNRDLLIHNIWE
ncbi:ATP-grasp domain-containing protein [Thermincola potens]|uniref:ATP-grasp domain-containing protein n=1 Tax=Thermincola potens (strain JR) TaxID=635013 RepID=D5XB60_THEPJ|nr:ATP-grasp domain-containing protein [Thermincola potens]ADG81380.1 protein of unknown function DUF201 [Thermincola potens JR]